MDGSGKFNNYLCQSIHFRFSFVGATFSLWLENYRGDRYYSQHMANFANFSKNHIAPGFQTILLFWRRLIQP